MAPQTCYNRPVGKQYLAGSRTVIDLHCHILPGLDDGPRSFDEALAMARMAEADGVQVIVATPHCNLDSDCPDPDLIRDRTGHLNDLLAREGLQLRVVPGGEVRATPDLVDAFEAGRVLTLGDRGRYILIELPPSGYPIFAGELFFRLQLAGVTPVLAHAERFDFFRLSPQRLQDMKDRGYPIQINAGSLLGEDGMRVRKQAVRLVQERLATVIASDGHNVDRRKPVLSVARQALRMDEDVFLKYTLDRPFRLLKEKRPAPLSPAGS